MTRKELIEKLQALGNDETEVKDQFEGNDAPDEIQDVIQEDDGTIIIKVA